MYFNIARPDIQKLLVNDSRIKLVVLGFVSCAGTVSRVRSLILALSTIKPDLPLRTPFSARPVTIRHAHVRCAVFVTEIPSRTSGVRSLIVRARLRLGSHPSARQERCL